MPTSAELLDQLQALANPDNVAGMAHFGINPANTLGISVKDLRLLARGVRDHQAALDLWRSGFHEARILAALVDDWRQVTPDQMESWALDFNSWDVCDQVCYNHFDRTDYAVEKALAWADREEEFVRRGGFALMAGLAVHNKAAPDELFLSFLPAIMRRASDERNFVKKAVNWALRQIGKRDLALREAALHTAREILDSAPNTAARWVARDAIRELAQK